MQKSTLAEVFLRLQLLGNDLANCRRSTFLRDSGLPYSPILKRVARRVTYYSNSESIRDHSPSGACDECNQLVRETQSADGIANFSPLSNKIRDDKRDRRI